MSFFGKIFKRKPGGTLFGNFLRGAANSLSGGVLGNGAAMLQPASAPVPQTTVAPTTSKNAYARGQVVAQPLGNAIASTPAVQTAQNKAVTSWAKTHWYFIALPLLLVGVIVYFLTKKKSKIK